MVRRIGQVYLCMSDPYQFYSIIAVVIDSAAIMGRSSHYLSIIGKRFFLLTILNGLQLAFKIPISRQKYNIWNSAFNSCCAYQK